MCLHKMKPNIPDTGTAIFVIWSQSLHSHDQEVVQPLWLQPVQPNHELRH